MDFVIVRANIINVHADAIVCPSNTGLKEGSGAARDIFKAAGRLRLTNACNKIGHGYVGSAVPTLAFDLNAKYIIHAVVPKWEDGAHDEYTKLSSTYLSCLQMADEQLNCKNIAFPLLASGNNGYDLELAFRIAQESINSYDASNLESVTLVIYGERIKAVIERLGYESKDLPVNIEKLQQQAENQEKRKLLIIEGKRVADNVLQEDCYRALHAFEDPAFRDKLLKKGADIARIAADIGVKKINAYALRF